MPPKFKRNTDTFGASAAEKVCLKCLIKMYSILELYIYDMEDYIFCEIVSYELSSLTILT